MRRNPRLGVALLGGLFAIMTALPGPAGAQSSDDLIGAPLPEEIRNALARPPGNTPPAGIAVLQEGPVDADSYRLGPGDEITVHYTGRTSNTHRLVVSPEGDVYLPDVGTVALAGRTLAEGKDRVRAAAGRILKGVRVDVSLTRLRTFKVSIGGEVRSPGMYPATAVTRLNELIKAAGGGTDSAAVRDVLVHGPATEALTHVDLLPFFLAGKLDLSNPYLLDGQSVFVPRRSRLVQVLGAVIHPGTYDLPESVTTVGALIDILGLMPDAAADRIEVVPASGRQGAGLTADATGPDGGAESGRPVGLSLVRDHPIEHGTQILVPWLGGFARPDLVTIDGEVRFPGTYSIAGEPDSKVADIVRSAGGLTDQAVSSRVRLVRPIPNRFNGQVRQLENGTAVDLTATEKEILRASGIGDFRAVVVDLLARNDGGPVLVPGDRILVPRGGTFVEVTGRVKRPGFYAWAREAPADRYVEMAGGYAERADRKNVRLASGPGDNFLLVKDAGPPEPGDRVWVPERTPRSSWDIAKDLLLVAGQVATILIVIDQAGSN